MRPVHLLAALLLTLGAGVGIVDAQELIAGEPPLGSSPINADGFIRADDMLLDPAQLSAPLVRTGNRPQSSTQFTYYQSEPWYWSLVPVRLPDNVTDNQRATFWAACDAWRAVAPIACIPWNGQEPYVTVTTEADGCYAQVGQARARTQRLNLAPANCWTTGLIAHELGHAFGLMHEHQRADRDQYIEIVPENMREEYRFAFDIIDRSDNRGAYDLLSIMHYGLAYFSKNGQPTMRLRPGLEGYADRIGQQKELSSGDANGITDIYNVALKLNGPGRATEAVKTRFDRTEFLGVMDQVHEIYRSRLGLNRANGLSIDGKPDFLGIAQWVFDTYLGARSSGFSRIGAFDVVVAGITQTEEWRLKHPGASPLTPPGFTRFLSFDREEFLSVLNRLDAFYASADGLQRSNGLSINGAPDFAGIATWIFDVYLNSRLTGGSPNASWVLVENAIKATDEWRRKH